MDRNSFYPLVSWRWGGGGELNFSKWGMQEKKSKLVEINLPETINALKSLQGMVGRNIVVRITVGICVRSLQNLRNHYCQTLVNCLG